MAASPPSSRPSKTSGPTRNSENDKNTKNTKSGAATGDKPSSRRNLVIGVLVVIAALLAGWLSQFAVDGGPADKGAGASAEGNADVEAGEGDSGGSPSLMALARRDGDDALAQGKKDAPVVMIEYSDFGCPFCGKFARDTEPKLVEKYIDKGLLRMEFRNFPIFGKGSERAARASWAAGEQGRFWQFHDAVYADEDAKSKGFGKGQLKDFAEQAGVSDLDRFAEDMDSKGAKKSVARDQEEAYDLGATSTPVFLVNGEPISGAQPDKVFTSAIDRAVAQAEKKEKGTAGKGGGE